MSSFEVDLITKGLVPLLIAWLAFRQKRYEHDLNILYAKQREKENGKAWQTQMRKPFRLFRKR